jgi:PAS domain S-box-containing protein
VLVICLAKFAPSTVDSAHFLVNDFIVEENMHDDNQSDDWPTGLAEVVLRSDVPIVVADAAMKDTPLVIVNDAFCEMSGYSRQEMIGTNCRFLQPSSGAGPVRARMRVFLADSSKMQSEFVIPNQRKDGSRFLNLLHMSKLTRANREPLIMGSQFDITTRSTDELASYNAALLQDIRLIKKLTKDEGWSMIEPHSTLAESLERIAQYKLTEA